MADEKYLDQFQIIERQFAIMERLDADDCSEEDRRRGVALIQWLKRMQSKAIEESQGQQEGNRR